ncbi:MAG: phosphate ABC transporter ATP-binding protein [Tissierellia bacterium]|nr:phosphate ABC transporter ATP-binding protein [Tissierellia bacterium]
MNILELKNLNISYKEKVILRNANLGIEQHSIVSIMGNSGSGKSTLFAAINGFLEEQGGSYSGEILFNSKNIKAFKTADLRRTISTLFQDSKPFDLSIEKNLTYAMEYYEGKVLNKKDRVRELLTMVNLYDEVKDNIHISTRKLSGGQKQRLCIARMLTTNPEILIFDEPFSSLDRKNTLIIEDLLRQLSKKYTILLSTHNEEQAERISDKIVRIDDFELKGVK